MRVLVGSKNPIKIQAVEEAFLKFFENVFIESREVNSDVKPQPINDETFIGARNRAFNLKQIDEKEKIFADYFIGIEGGVTKQFGRWFAFGGMCIINSDGEESYGTSPHFELPQRIIKRIENHEELGHIMDEIMNENNTKQKGGAIGFLSNGVMNRKELYVPGLISALIPFINEELYFSKKNSLLL